MKHSQPTREKILDVVYALVYIHGYNGTSMSMILKECGIPKGSLYHFFTSKKEMVLAVLKERISPKMDEFYQLGTPPLCMNIHFYDILNFMHRGVVRSVVRIESQ